MRLLALIFLSLYISLPSYAEVTIIFSGEESGYLEPCGCTKEPLGGIAKRHSLLSLQGGPNKLLPISLGDLVGHVTRQNEIKMETMVESLRQMDYILHNIGEKDIHIGPEVLSYIFYSSPLELLSSNVLISSSYGLKVSPFVIKEIEEGGTKVKIGFLGILSPYLLEDNHKDIEIIPPSEALRPLVNQLKDRVDLLILLSHAPFEESLNLSSIFPEFQLIVSGHDVDHPIVRRSGNTTVVTCGTKGKHIGLYQPLHKPGRLEIFTLDDRYHESQEMLSLLQSYQQRLRDEDLLSKVERQAPPGDAAYAGNIICGTCHQAAFLHWKTTGHATAYETLVRVEHQYDPECISCHVTGLYYTTGFESIENTPLLKGVGCEACHGPGSLHKEQAIKGLKAEGYGKSTAGTCQTCHDLEHGPDFHFEGFWQKIIHPKEEVKG